MYKDYVLSQYANSPRIISLLKSFEQSLQTENDINNFYEKVYNIKTASGFGLDYWGAILNIPRILSYEGDTYTLDDDLYKFLLTVRAVANITNCTIPSLEDLLNELFKDRGNVYVFETGIMSLRFVFNFYLSDQEKTILSIKGIPPLPTGVGVEIIEIPESEIFGFNGTGYQPFNQAPFRPLINSMEDYATKEYVTETHQELYNELNSKKQDNLIIGEGVEINNDTISALNTTVDDENLIFNF